MGQGYSLTTLSAGSARIDVPELADLTYEKSLGDARFMKTVRARHHEGLVIVKVVMKPYSSMKFDKYIKDIIRERNILTNIPNALGYHRAFETSSNGYLLRQYIHNSIYDRMSTRPFLEDIEKRWLAYQLLCAVRDCHAMSLYHGDIKTENTLVTSWNWLYLTDFSSSFKPTYLPEDNPAEFSFYFDIAGRRTCYLAPERFLRPGETAEDRQGVTWAMDIFSTGCVIAELFLESPIFNLSQLFNYRKGEFNPEKTVLQKIDDSDVREMVIHMIQVEPESRYSADEYLNFWRNRAFPEYFYSFLHPFMYLITDPSNGRSPLTAGNINLGESDDRIDRIYTDFDKIAYFLNYKDTESGDDSKKPAKTPNGLYPLYLDIPRRRRMSLGARISSVVEDDGTLLFLSVVTSAIRSTARAASRVRACELLLAFAENVTDESKLDRILPFVMTLLNDTSDIVKVAAIRTLTQLLAIVSTTTPVNAYLFPEYILPRLEPFTLASGKKPSPLVRATYASSLAIIAESASRFLDLVEILKSEGMIPSTDPQTEDDTQVQEHCDSYDTARAGLIKYFETQTKSLLTDNNPDVRRAFLGSISSLCVFFGSVKTSDVILSHLNTYLNDRDWRLKSAFFEAIVGVAVYVGATSLEEFILPLMVPALTDPEEAVTEKVLRSLGAMAKLGLFQRSVLWRLIELVVRFTMHPNEWMREAAASFCTSSATYLSQADLQCLVRPMLEPYMRVYPASLDEIDILDCLKEPLSRPVVEMAITWASKADKGVFWKTLQQRSMFNLMDDRVPLTPHADLAPNALSRYTKNEEDHQWISRLRNAGMSHEDEFKLLALKGYIWRIASQKPVEDEKKAFNTNLLNSIIPLKDLGVSLKTVFFDHSRDILDTMVGQNKDISNDLEKPQTITDALLDASTAIDERIDETRERQSSITTEQNQRIHALKAEGSPPSRRPASVDSHSEDEDSASNKQRNSSNTPVDRELHHKVSSSTISTQRTDRPSLQKETAMNLMRGGRTITKANAQTVTSAENAMGKIDAPSSREQSTKPPLVRAREEKAQDPKKLMYRSAHSYAGRDPNILRLLDTVYLDSHPVDLMEFGTTVTPVENRRWEKRPTSTSWRPEGTLVAMLSEHTASVRRVLVSADHLFFITGSDDGTVKIWDTTRLERNLSHRSRQTHKHNAGAKVTCLCFIQGTHSFVSTSNDGCVHAVRVTCVEVSPGDVKYGKLKLIRNWKLPQGAHAVWVEHVKMENQSVLLIATDQCQVLGVDLKTMDILYTLKNPAQHGTPTTFCIDSQHHWLLLGTFNGKLDLWDLRFGLRLKAWAFAGRAPIHRVTLHPRQKLDTESMQRAHNGKPVLLKRVCLAGGTGDNSITVWNLEKGTCQAVYRVATPTPFNLSSTSANSDIYTLKDISSSTSFSAAEIEEDFELNLRSDLGIRAFVTGLLPRSEAEASRRTRPFLVAAGPERKVRLWNLDKVPNSCVVSGLEAEEAQPSYVSMEGDELRTSAEVWEERGSYLTSIQDTSSKGSAGQKAAAAINPGAKRTSTAEGSSATGVRTRPAAGSRNTVISVQQQQLLKTHLDMVTDVAVLEYPMRLVVSVDRSGVIMVYS